MAKYELKLIRASLFNIAKENDESGATHLNDVNLENVQESHVKMRHIFEENICRKVMGDETIYSGTKGAKKAAVEVIHNKSFRGKKPTTYYSKIILEKDREEYENALNCTDEKEFKKSCAQIANRFALGLSYPKGIICFLHFTFQLTRGQPQKFLAILNTDYKTDIVKCDTATTKILDYISDVFEDNFKSTILYPYVVEEVNKETNQIQSLKQDREKLKIYLRDKSKYDPKFYKTAGVDDPIDIQENLLKYYEELDQRPIEYLKDVMGKELELADLKISIGNVIFDINARDFIDNVKLITTPFGEGVLIKNSFVKVLIGKHDLFREGKILKLDVSDLLKDDSKKGIRKST